MMRQVDPQHVQKRSVLRVVGILLLALGLILTITGFASLFSTMGSGESSWELGDGRVIHGTRDDSGPPKYFWCAFVGLPLLAVGASLTAYGFKGAVLRYAVGEVAPVAKDTINYVAEGAKDGIETISSAIGRGIASARGPAEATAITKVRCPKCNHENDADAKFCSECAFSLRKTRPCPHCGELNDPDAKFCDDCGQAFR
jgi:hypothetical protein